MRTLKWLLNMLHQARSSIFFRLEMNSVLRGPTPSFEAVRLIVSEGEEIPPHKVKGELSFYCIEGLAQIGLSDNEVILLSARQWLYLRGNEVHSIRGLQNASLLMTILFEVP